MFAVRQFDLERGFSAIEADELNFINGGSNGYNGWDGRDPGANGGIDPNKDYTAQTEAQLAQLGAIVAIGTAVANPNPGTIASAAIAYKSAQIATKKAGL